MQSMPLGEEARATEATGIRAWAPCAACVSTLLIGVWVALALFAWHRHWQSADLNAREQRLASRVAASIQGEIAALTALARAFQTLYIASDEVSDAEFAHAFSTLSPDTDSRTMVAVGLARREYVDGSEHYITRLVAPVAGNEALLGLDVASQPENMRALLRARDGGEVVLSAPFVLIQSPPDQPILGAVVRLPVFAPGPLPVDVGERRQRHVGSIAVSFRVAPIIEQVLAQEDRGDYALEIADVTDTQPVRLLAAAQPLPDAAALAEFGFGGRSWRVRVLATQTPQAWAPWLTLALALLVAFALAGMVAMGQNTSRRAQALARAWSRQHRESEQRLRVLNEMLPALVALIDATDGRVVYLNRAARTRLEVQRTEDVAIARMIVDPNVLLRLIRVASGGAPLVDETVQVRSVQDARFWVSLSVSRIDLDGRSHLLAVGSDVSEMRELNQRLAWQASHDELTGLCNRRAFERHMQECMQAVERGDGCSALLYLDLDQFKLVNDTSGHAAGDRLLADMAAVLRMQMHQGDVLARLGGDEFGMLLAVTDIAHARIRAENIRACVDGFVFTAGERRYTLTCSIGVAMLRVPLPALHDLLAAADTACYLAKDLGRNRVQFFTEEDAASAQRRSEMEWVGRLREALEHDRLLLYYQVLASADEADGGGGAHVEMLLRLREADGTVVNPGAFLPAAERFGLMSEIDRWVVATTLRNIHHILPATIPLARVAINLSAHSAGDPAFADFIVARMRQFEVDPATVCFEITETAAVGNLGEVRRFMQILHAQGCLFALDDFGAGMASFGYLRSLPVDVLKIDGSFVVRMLDDSLSRSIVEAVTRIAHELRIEVIAEWVDDAPTAEALRALAVDWLQGYSLHVPAPARFQQPAG